VDGPRRVTLRVADDERAQRLNALRLGEIELSDARRTAGRQKAGCAGRA
jgi:hypothetical protein